MYSCDSGYVLTSDRDSESECGPNGIPCDPVRACGSNGTSIVGEWSGDNLVCISEGDYIVRHIISVKAKNAEMLFLFMYSLGYINLLNQKGHFSVLLTDDLGKLLRLLQVEPLLVLIEMPMFSIRLRGSNCTT